MATWISDAASLGDLFKRNCGKHAAKVAYRKPTKAGFVDITYAEALEEVYKYARAIDSYKLQRGETVALVCETCIEWAFTDWAAQTLGLVLVPIYPTLPADQAQYIANDCEAKLVIVQDEKQAAKFPNHQIVLLKDGLLDRDSGLTREDWDNNCDQSLTDSNAHMRGTAWYRRRLGAHFHNAGGGIYIKRDANVVLYSLESF